MPVYRSGRWESMSSLIGVGHYAFGKKGSLFGKSKWDRQ